MAKKRDPFRVAIGRRLQILRIAKGHPTIRGFAEVLDVQEDRYDSWEKGKALIQPPDVAKLRKLFGVSADWVYYGDPSQMPHGLVTELQKTKPEKTRA